MEKVMINKIKKWNHDKLRVSNYRVYQSKTAKNGIGQTMKFMAKLGKTKT